VSLNDTFHRQFGIITRAQALAYGLKTHQITAGSRRAIGWAFTQGCTALPRSAHRGSHGCSRRQ